MKCNLESLNARSTMSLCRPFQKQSPPLRSRVSAYTTSAERGGVSFGDAMTTIEKFPSHISREAFAWYISGLTDGEGCFALLLGAHHKRRQRRYTPCASFVINLRADDDGVLKLIQSFFQCGRLVYGKTRNMCHLRFRTHPELKMILDHFNKTPLLAKKKKDFEIWKKGVSMILQISRRRQLRGRGLSCYKWSKDEHNEFVFLKSQLAASRLFSCDSRPIEEYAKEETSELLLFR